jgi:fatty acid desaturase
MFRPYGRVLLLHGCIIAGAFGVLFFGAPLTLVVLLMLGKTAIDAKVHLMFHGQAYFANRVRSPGKNAKSKEQNSV